MIGALLALLPWTKNVNDKVNTNLNAKVSSRAAQTTVDTINGKIDVTLSTRASQTDMTTVKTNADVKTSTRASSTDMSTLLGRLPSDAPTKLARLDQTISSVAAAVAAVTPIASIQTGVVSDPSPLSGASNEYETRYVNVPISAVADINKCDVQVTGYCSSSTDGNIQAAGRLTTTTNLRIGVSGSTGSTYGVMRARWRVIEYK